MSGSEKRAPRDSRKVNVLKCILQVKKKFQMNI